MSARMILGVVGVLIALAFTGPAQAQAVDAGPPAAAHTQQVGIVEIAFGAGSAMLSTPSRQQLDAIAQRMLAKPRARLQVQGLVADDEADPAGLRARRVDVVRRWIVSSGVASTRIEVPDVPVRSGDADARGGARLRLIEP